MSESTLKPLLEVKELKKHFPVRSGLLRRNTGDVRAVDGVSFTLGKGESLGLVGESGCGKSTLGRTVIRLYEPTSGSIVFKGEDITVVRGSRLRSMRERIQMIFQDPYASLNPRHTVGYALEEPLIVHGQGDSAARAEKVRALLSEVGINPEFAQRYPHEFSGGQRQRISIARAIALHPELIIADEPVSALDVSIQAQVLNLLTRLQGKLGLSMLFVSHDLGVVEYLCDRVAVMYLGRVVEMGPRDRIFAHPAHPYTRALLDAVPKVGQGKRRARRSLAGDVPSPLNPPSGCAFHPRCPFAKDECRVTAPALAAVRADEPDHQAACWLLR